MSKELPKEQEINDYFMQINKIRQLDKERLFMFQQFKSEKISKFHHEEHQSFKTVDKKLKIKKNKKVQKKSNKSEEAEEIEIESLQNEKMENLIDDLYNQVEKILIVKGRRKSMRDIEPEQLLSILEMIETEYQKLVEWMNQEIQKEKNSLGYKENDRWPKNMLMRFISTLNKYLPQIKEVLIPFENRYSQKLSFKVRYKWLVQKSVTPILRIMSDDFFSNDSYDMPDQFGIEDLNKQDSIKEQQVEVEENKKKKKKKKKNGVEKCELEENESEEEKEISQLNSFLQKMIIKQQARQQCHISEDWLIKWTMKSEQMRSKKTIMGSNKDND